MSNWDKWQYNGSDISKLKRVEDISLEDITKLENSIYNSLFCYCPNRDKFLYDHAIEIIDSASATFDGEPDQNIYLYDKKKRTSSMPFSIGTAGRCQATSWIDDDVFIMMGYIYQWSDTLKDNSKPPIRLFLYLCSVKNNNIEHYLGPVFSEAQYKSIWKKHAYYSREIRHFKAVNPQ